MDPSLYYLFGLTVMMIVLIGFVIALMWLAERLGYWRVALAIGAAGTVYFAFSAIQTLIFCSGGSVLVSAMEGAPAERVPVCTGAGEVLTRTYALLAAPSGALFLGVMTWQHWRAWKEMDFG